MTEPYIINFDAMLTVRYPDNADVRALAAVLALSDENGWISAERLTENVAYVLVMLEQDAAREIMWILGTDLLVRVDSVTYKLNPKYGHKRSAI